jgi:hypothetical protein
MGTGVLTLEQPVLLEIEIKAVRALRGKSVVEFYLHSNDIQSHYFEERQRETAIFKPLLLW